MCKKVYTNEIQERERKTNEIPYIETELTSRNKSRDARGVVYLIFNGVNSVQTNLEFKCFTKCGNRTKTSCGNTRNTFFFILF